MLDTNAVIGYLGDDQALMDCIDTRGLDEDIALPTIVVVELLGYPAITEAHTQEIEVFLQSASLFDLTPSLAREAAHIRRTYALATADAVIAATALQAHAPLVTRDKKFTKIPTLICIVP